MYMIREAATLRSTRNIFSTIQGTSLARHFGVERAIRLRVRARTMAIFRPIRCVYGATTTRQGGTLNPRVFIKVIQHARQRLSTTRLRFFIKFRRSLLLQINGKARPSTTTRRHHERCVIPLIDVSIRTHTRRLGLANRHLGRRQPTNIATSVRRHLTQGPCLPKVSYRGQQVFSLNPQVRPRVNAILRHRVSTLSFKHDRTNRGVHPTPLLVKGVSPASTSNRCGSNHHLCNVPHCATPVRRATTHNLFLQDRRRRYVMRSTFTIRSAPIFLVNVRPLRRAPLFIKNNFTFVGAVWNFFFRVAAHPFQNFALVGRPNNPISQGGRRFF